MSRLIFLALMAYTFLITPSSQAAEGDLRAQFDDTIRPFLNRYCIECHSEEERKGDLDLSRFSSLESVLADFPHWAIVLDQLEEREMPPKKAKQQLPDTIRASVVEWIHAVRRQEADRNAGDPGPVLARRLSNAEYDYTIRDLTGVDIRPAKEFPVDPANQDGFDNTGESLTMSPSLVKKYLEAARLVADYLVLKPDGFEFAPHPIVTDTDRDKFAVKRIIQFYQQQPTNYAAYFFSAWRFDNRDHLGRGSAELAAIAKEDQVSPRYLATVWKTLTGSQESVGPIAALQLLWRELPRGQDADVEAVRDGCKSMASMVTSLREQLRPEVENLTVRGVHNGSQPLVLWKDREMASHRRRYMGGALDLDAGAVASHPKAHLLLRPPEAADAQDAFEKSFERFCEIFPDAFYIPERARPYLDPKRERLLSAGRHLSAGFHSQVGYFRDDEPLYDLILDESGRNELDRLWTELNFITFAPARQHRDFLWFERTDSRFMRDPEFDFARPEDDNSISDEMIKGVAEVYLAKVRKATTNELPIRVIGEHFENVSINIRAVEKMRRDAEPRHLSQLQTFAERAYRRPLGESEKQEILTFYKHLRTSEELEHEDAVRDVVVSILMSPHFCYRVNLPEPGARSNLTAYELASRLSYFLWSSMPDAELLAKAATGELTDPSVLAAQAKRMLKDARAERLAVEFAGNWLDFRRFEEHNSVDRERFATFDNELRLAMFEEPIRFFTDLLQNERPVLDFLYGKHTFVNAPLAKHYGIPFRGASNEWVRVDDANNYQRGGLLPMSVFLTKNSPGLRTSPVKRGYWVVRRVLGEHIPPPPPNVAELPADESKLGALTLRETLERHRADQSCASCHDRFDGVGLVFEGYGPVGEVRERDFGGRPVDVRATFPGGEEGVGLQGLIDYVRKDRQDDFEENLCRKLLAYGLGRGLLLSDDSTVKEMRAKLASNNHRFSSIVESIVTSPQFLTKRGSASLSMK